MPYEVGEYRLKMSQTTQVATKVSRENLPEAVFNFRPNRIIEGAHHILIADDEPLQRDLVGKMLTDAGYNVWKARDAQEAWEIIQTLGEQGYVLALGIIDVNMPLLPIHRGGILNGICLVQRLREAGHLSPF